MEVSKSTTFDQLPPGQVRAVVAWCQSHDWGTHARFADGKIGGLEDVSYRAGDDEATVTIVGFTTLGAIRDWAGY